MHPDILYESLMCLPRDDLDACQLAAKILRDLIAEHNTLPLRYIHLTTLEVFQDHGSVTLWRDPDEEEYQIELPADGPYDYSLSRLDNAFMKCLRLCDDYDQSLPTFCDRMVPLNFKVGQVSFDDHIQETETRDRTAKCLAEKLGVTSYKLSMGDFGASYVVLPSALHHEVVRSTVQDLAIQVCGGAHTLSLFDLALTMNGKARLTLTFSVANRGVVWAGDFIQKFIVAENTSRVPAVVSVMQRMKTDDRLENYLPDACTVPRKRGVDSPGIRYVDHLGNCATTGSDLYVFANATGGSELHVNVSKARQVSKNERKVKVEYAVFVMTTV